MVCRMIVTHIHVCRGGAFPRVLGHYSRERKLFTLTEAVRRRMTTLSADHFGLKQRGRIAVGCWADLCHFLILPPLAIKRRLFLPNKPLRHPLGLGQWRDCARKGVPSSSRHGQFLDRRQSVLAHKLCSRILALISQQSKRKLQTVEEQKNTFIINLLHFVKSFSNCLFPRQFSQSNLTHGNNLPL